MHHEEAWLALSMGAGLNNDLRTHGLWEVSAPPAPDTGSLRQQLSADVAIVGAGYTGLSAALHLAERGYRSVVVEARDLGFGGSGRNVGLVNAGLWVKPLELIERLGEHLGVRLIQQLADAPSLVFELIARYQIECEPVQRGTLHCAVGDRGLKDIEERERQWQSFGAPVERLDAKETLNKVGSSAYLGSLLDRRAGTLQPLAYTRGLARAAISHGASIFTDTAVIRATDLGDRWQLVTSDGGVTAPWVIVATNAYSDGPWGHIGRELTRLPYFNLATRPLDLELQRGILPEGHGIWDTCNVLSSLRLDRAGRLIFGSVGALRGSGLAVHPSWGRRALKKLFPQLRKVKFDHEWYGWIGMTEDALPRFHRLDRNMISFSGYNGRGIAPGTSFGRDLARLVSGQMVDADLALPTTPCTRAPFRAMREVMYEWGSQIAHVTGARV